MLKPISLPIALLFAFSAFINFSFSFKENKAPKKLFVAYAFNDSVNAANNITLDKIEKTTAVDVYEEMNLDKKGLSKQAFDLALKGYNNLLHK